jgi:hypothetical protein
VRARSLLAAALLALGCASGPARSTGSAPPDAEDAPVDAARAESPDARATPVDAAAPAPDAAPTVDEAPPDAAPMPPLSSAPVAHRFLKGFSGGGSVAIVGRDGKIEWELPIPDHEANDAWLVPNGNVLFAFKTGCREVTPAKQTVFEFHAATGAEIHSCQPLPDGKILVGESGGDGISRLYEVTHEKQLLRTIEVQSGGGSHNQLRQIRKTPEGTYLVSQQRGGGKARELDATGKVLRTFPCGQFVAIRLPDGNTLLACGDEHRIVEVDRTDQIVWEVKETDIPGNRLGFVAGLQRLPNGNTVVCNWSGHSGLDNQPQVFELTRDKKLVWQVMDKRLDKISSIEILDPETDVGGQVLR